MNKDIPFIIWHTSQRTEGVFCESVKHLNVVEIHNPHIIKKTKFKRRKYLFSLLRKKHCKGIIIDGEASFLILLICKILKVSIFMRSRGGMSGEFHDYVVIKNKFFRCFIAMWKKFKYNLTLVFSTKIFVVSIFGKSQILYELPIIDLKRIKVLYKPVDFETIENVEKGKLRTLLNIETNNKILLTATNFNYKRKYEALLEYNPVIVEKLRDHQDWIYIILGGGSDIDKFKNLLSKTTPEDISKRVFVFGFYQNIYETLADSDLFVYMSYRDMGPQIVKEAQASNLTVFGNHSCFGSNEFIQNNPAYNLLFETHQELSVLLSELMTNNELRAQLGMFNREYAAYHYNATTIASNFLSEIATSNYTNSTFGLQL